MAVIHRIYISYSTDDGDTWSGMDEVYPGPGGSVDFDSSVTREQVYYQSSHDKHMDVLFTQNNTAIWFATAPMLPVPFKLRINKLNRKRTTGNEL